MRNSFRYALLIFLLLCGCKKTASVNKIPSLIEKNAVLSEIGGVYSEIPFHYVDLKGNVYLGNLHKTCIDKYSKEGKFRFSFGRKGEGPGEFKYIYPFAVNSREELYVIDEMKKELFTFSPDGKYKSSFRIEMPPQELFVDIKFTPADKLLLLTMDKIHLGQKLYLIDNGKARLIREDFKRSVKNRQDFGPFPLPFFPLAFTGDENGRIFVADSVDYKIYIFNSKGKLVGKKDLPWQEEEITRKDYTFHSIAKNINHKVKRFQGYYEVLIKKLPKLTGTMRYFPAIIQLNYDRGKLYVWTSKINKKDEYIIDVYDSTLRFLYRRTAFTCPASHRPVFIRNGEVFTPDFDVDFKTGRLNCNLRLINSTKMLRFKIPED